MIKNRTIQLIFQTIYCTLGFVGVVASLGIFDNIDVAKKVQKQLNDIGMTAFSCAPISSL